MKKHYEGSIDPLGTQDCSPSLLTPETDAMLAADLHHLEDDESCPASAYWRMVELTRTLERERDEWRKKAVDLHARYKGALEDIETAIAERNMARATANIFRQCAEVTFGVMPFPRKFHWEVVQATASADTQTSPKETTL
jgi:hypothetical protein